MFFSVDDYFDEDGFARTWLPGDTPLPDPPILWYGTEVIDDDWGLYYGF